MNKTLSLALLVGGIVLSIIAYSVYDATGSDVSRFFTDSPTDKSVWLLVCGGIATVLGALSLPRGAKPENKLTS